MAPVYSHPSRHRIREWKDVTVAGEYTAKGLMPSAHPITYFRCVAGFRPYNQSRRVDLYCYTRLRPAKTATPILILMQASLYGAVTISSSTASKSKYESVLLQTMSHDESNRYPMTSKTALQSYLGCIVNRLLFIN